MGDAEILETYLDEDGWTYPAPPAEMTQGEYISHCESLKFCTRSILELETIKVEIEVASMVPPNGWDRYFEWSARYASRKASDPW